jgi:pectate lyase C
MLHKTVVGLVVAGVAAGTCAIAAWSYVTPASAQAVGITLTATPGDGQVSLSWSYQGVTAAVQEIYRDTDSNPTGRVRIASVSTATRSFVATGQTNGVTFFYWVKNTNAGVITNSNAASATPGGGGGAITGASCPTNGPEIIVRETIRITSGTFDGGCRRYNAGPELGDGSQDEGQAAVFRVENGATLRNVVIGPNGADGVHVRNGAIIDNVHWLNVGEDALTVESSGTTIVRNIEGYDADDKFFQINAASTLQVSNCIIHRAGKALRQNGGTTFRIDVSFDRCDINSMNEGVFRTDSSTSTARLTNSRLHDAGSVCIGRWASCTQSGNSNY